MRICPDGLSFILPFAILAVVLAVAGLPAVATGAAAIALVIGAFFRDPDRVALAPPEAIVSPADGKVVAVGRAEHGGPTIAIFLSLLDVHVARAPMDGRLVRCERKPGGYAAAQKPSASNNARVQMEFATAHGPATVCLMAGLVARRVLPWVKAPVALRRGQRVAIIRFGSRSEMTFPPKYQSTVRVGDRVRAGETVIAMPSSASPDHA